MKILLFDIGGTSIKYGICEESRLTFHREAPTEAAQGGRHILEKIAALVSAQNGYDAIGISTAGQIDADSGSVIYANSNIPEYTGMHIREALENMFHVPVVVENDVNAAAIGEGAYGAGRGWQSFLCLTYGTGVGGAIVQDGTIYHGASFSAGEFGGMVIHGRERKSQGDVFAGCYERYASTTALVKTAIACDPLLTDGRLIFEQLHRKEVKDIVDHWIDEIILGLVSVIHIFNPSLVVLGGGIMAQPYIMDEIHRKLPAQLMPSFSRVKVAAASLGNTAGMLGINYLAEICLKNR